MSRSPRDIGWRDHVIATRVHEARRGYVRTDRNTRRRPAGEQVRHVSREHIVAADAAQPVSDRDDRSDTPAAAEARRFFDALFDIAFKEQAPKQADAETAATAAEQP